MVRQEKLQGQRDWVDTGRNGMPDRWSQEVPCRSCRPVTRRKAEKKRSMSGKERLVSQTAQSSEGSEVGEKMSTALGSKIAAFKRWFVASDQIPIPGARKTLVSQIALCPVLQPQYPPACSNRLSGACRRGISGSGVRKSKSQRCEGKSSRRSEG